MNVTQEINLMKIPKRALSYSFLIFLVLFVFVGLSSCTTLSMETFAKLSENDLFNTAQLYQQDAISDNQRLEAMRIYQYYIDKFDTHPYRVMESRYEIGFINFYLENYDEAEKIFRDLIQEYNEGGNKYTPQWIFILSTKLKDEIVQARKEKILKESEKAKKK